MVKSTQEYLSFNRGRLSRLGMARVDLKRSALSASIMTNWMPRVLGSMMLRPGLGYINTQPSATKLLPFIFATADTALIEVHDGSTSFTIDDSRLTRATVTAAVTNGNFDTNLTGWTSIDAGTVNAWQTGGYLGLAGDGTSIASIQQQVTVNEAGVEHALRIVVQRGPVVVRVGSASNGIDYLEDVELGTGVHSLAFTPSAGSFYVKFFNQNNRLALVSSCNVESAGAVNLTSPWTAGDLQSLRYDQSGDIVFVACDGMQQRRIMRRSDRSWSIEAYLSDDGPFRIENTSTTTLAPSALVGNITVTSSTVSGSGVFRASHVGALFSITSLGQQVEADISAQNIFTSSIRVTGVGTSRTFSVIIAGTWTGTVTLQRSYDNSVWADVGSPFAWTANVTGPVTDGLDNQIVYYRVGIKTGDYGSGTAECSLVIGSGSITGVVRVTAYSSSSSVSAEVLSALGGTAASEVWAEGAWSDYRGWPSSVKFHDGRLFWAGKDKFWGSVTDQFYTFDPEFEGDAGPISRSIGYGPVDSVNWMVSLNRLLAGTDGAVVECKSSSLDEPLTPTNFTPKTPATRGCENVDAVKIDNTAIFVQRSGFRLFEIDNGIGANGSVLSALTDLTILVPEACEPGVVTLAVQREPDTRLHCVLSDGTAAVLVWDRAENVQCWVKVETDGLIEDACALPGDEEDAVYYIVKRTINGSDARYLERWAYESECRGAAINKLADSFVYAAGSASTITGLSHLEGETVVAWGGGADLGTFTVAGGSITLPAAVTNRCAGLAYAARFKSTKLAYSLPDRSALTLAKKIHHLGLIMVDTHPQGLEFGPSFDTMDPLPETERYEAVDADEVWDEYDAEAIEFPGEWDTDARLCMRATAPRSCTLLAAIVDMDANR